MPEFDRCRPIQCGVFQSGSQDAPGVARRGPALRCVAPRTAGCLWSPSGWWNPIFCTKNHSEKAPHCWGTAVALPSGVVAHSPCERRLPTDRWARGCLHRERSKAQETIRAWWPLDLETRPRRDPIGPPRLGERDFVFPTWFKCTAKNNSAVFNAFAGQLNFGFNLEQVQWLVRL